MIQEPEYGLFVLICILVTVLFLHNLKRNIRRKAETNPYAVALEDLVQKSYSIGYFSKSEKFVELSNLYIDGTHMYCIQNGYNISVSHVIAKDKGLPKARWLDHVHVQIYSTYHEMYILLRDYVVMREHVTIT